MRASIVINTDGRVEGLRRLLANLRYLDYPEFEVCVVAGPTPDGTAELLQEWDQWIKVDRCPVKNLSVSRNIGIALAAGEIVAFLDDDALAEPEWLDQIVSAFADPQVAAAGGLVYDHTGRQFQYRYASANRLGAADWRRTTPADEYNFPLSDNFPYVQGTNSAFRRDVLIGIGGFDEEYDYYLDETDVCCRLIDAGWTVKQLSNAYVHHKFLPSNIRNEHRVATHRYSIVKNKIYFSIKNNKGHYSFERLVRDALDFTEEHRRDIAFHASAGRLAPEVAEHFEREMEDAWRHGLARGTRIGREGLDGEKLARFRAPFLPFPRLTPAAGRRTFCFLSWDYPPDHAGGIARYSQQVARAVGRLGHHVHVVTKSPDVERVDFEDGVWVHRVTARDMPQEEAAGPDAPDSIWNASATMLAEVERIGEHRRIDCVEAPIWDVEGCAVLRDGRFPLVTSLHTTMAQWLASHRAHAADPGYMKTVGRAMLALEREMTMRSDGVHANSEAIVAAIERDHGIAVERSRTVVIPHGMEDLSSGVLPAPREDGTIEILFVGRLERRKGIDVLLAAAEMVVPEIPAARFVIVGDDTIVGDEGAPYRSEFEARHADDVVRRAVAFLGKVPDHVLLARYAAADIFVCPSRFESFGLVALEAMMFAKPVIAADAGGLAEVIRDGETGLLVKPGDPAALAEALIRMMGDRELRARIGLAGRRSFETDFGARRMGEEVARFLARFARDEVGTDCLHFSGSTEPAHLRGEATGRRFGRGTRLKIAAQPGRYYLTFWAHDWSGFADIAVAGVHQTRVDLFARQATFRTAIVDVRAPAAIIVTRGGRSHVSAQDDQVIFYRAQSLPVAGRPAATAARELAAW